VEHWFSEALIKWYGLNKRNLPWRETKDPYKIWLSEIILQQTQVIQGTSYYFKFIKNYPTVKKLANSSIESVLKDWQGLGYYSRARNLHYTAGQILQNHNGVFPNSYHEIRKLKGIGDYTAAAIASFSFDLPFAGLDGNVFRVLSRVFGIKTPIDSTSGKKVFKELAQSLIDMKYPAIYNQAIMEFGSQQCRPVNPDCANCPLVEKCWAFNHEAVKVLPIKDKKIKVKNRYLNYFVLKNKNKVAFFKREKKDIWQGLNEFYLIETNESSSFEDLLPQLIKKFKKIRLSNSSKEIKHVLSHQLLFCRFYVIEVVNPPEGYEWIAIKDLQKLAWPRLIDNYINTCLLN
jgi:A/G-specific adenine glycosylase